MACEAGRAGGTMNRLNLGELTREEIRGLAPRTTVVVPTGAVEQHGPHLPVDLDVRVCLHVCEAAARLVTAQIPILIAPALSFGISNHHKPHPGVLSLTPGTYQAVLMEVVCCLAESGFRRIAIVNAHGGNQEANAIVAREVRNRHAVSTAAISYWTVAQSKFVESEISKENMKLPGHAGRFETALMLAVREDLVRSDALPERKSNTASDRPAAPHGGVVFLAGQRQGDNDGYSDQPGEASKADGARYLEIIVASVARFLVDFHKAHPE